MSRENRLGTTWSLYRVRSAVVKNWRLQHYPFDTQILHVNIGLENPLQPVNLGLTQENSFQLIQVFCCRVGVWTSPAPTFLALV